MPIDGLVSTAEDDVHGRNTHGGDVGAHHDPDIAEFALDSVGQPTTD